LVNLGSRGSELATLPQPSTARCQVVLQGLGSAL
jgi:hypothetical protein